VLQLDGTPHRWRKQLFMSLVTAPQVERLVDRLDSEWRLALEQWQKKSRVVLYDEVAKILCRGVCAWAGVPPGEDLDKRTHELTSIVDGAASFGLRTARDLYLRARCNRWARRMVREVREGKIILDATMPVVVVSEHHDENGDKLPVDRAAGISLASLRRRRSRHGKERKLEERACERQPSRSEPPALEQVLEERFVIAAGSRVALARLGGWLHARRRDARRGLLPSHGVARARMDRRLLVLTA